MIKYLKIRDKKYRLNPHGLNGAANKIIKEVATAVLDNIVKQESWILHRCTFFASSGIDYLLKATENKQTVVNPRIEGNDANPFNQHYWLAFDIQPKGKPLIKDVLLDPIFKYIGLQAHAEDLLDPDYIVYYAKKRIVPPNKPVWEGGVRVKTLSI